MVLDLNLREQNCFLDYIKVFDQEMLVKSILL